MNTFAQTHGELLQYIFSFLPPVYRLFARLTCRRWCELLPGRTQVGVNSSLRAKAPLRLIQYAVKRKLYPTAGVPVHKYLTCYSYDVHISINVGSISGNKTVLHAALNKCSEIVDRYSLPRPQLEKCLRKAVSKDPLIAPWALSTLCRKYRYNYAREDARHPIASLHICSGIAAGALKRGDIELFAKCSAKVISVYNRRDIRLIVGNSFFDDVYFKLCFKLMMKSGRVESLYALRRVYWPPADKYAEHYTKYMHHAKNIAILTKAAPSGRLEMSPRDLFVHFRQHHKYAVCCELLLQSAVPIETFRTFYFAPHVPPRSSSAEVDASITLSTFAFAAGIDTLILANWTDRLIIDICMKRPGRLDEFVRSVPDRGMAHVLDNVMSVKIMEYPAVVIRALVERCIEEKKYYRWTSHIHILANICGQAVSSGFVPAFKYAIDRWNDFDRSCKWGFLRKEKNAETFLRAFRNEIYPDASCKEHD